MKFMLFAPVVGVKDVINVIMGGSVISMLWNFIPILTYLTQVMEKTAQNVKGLEL